MRFALVLLFLFLLSKGHCEAPLGATDNKPQLPLEIYADEFAEILGGKPQLVILPMVLALRKARLSFYQR